MPIDQDALERARAAWTFRGQQRPAFAHVPSEGQESVWDYPRPPLYVRDARPIEIHAGTRCLARSDVSIRVLETGSPPSLYLPPEAFDASLLHPSPRRTLCEWRCWPCRPRTSHYCRASTPRSVRSLAQNRHV